VGDLKKRHDQRIKTPTTKGKPRRKREINLLVQYITKKGKSQKQMTPYSATIEIAINRGFEAAHEVQAEQNRSGKTPIGS